MKVLRPLARFSYRRRWPVLGIFILFLTAASIYGSGASDELVTGGFDDPASESAGAAEVLEETFDLGEPDVVIAYSHPTVTVADPRFEEKLRPVLEKLSGRPEVEDLTTPYGPMPGALISQDGRAAVVTLQLAGEGAEEEEAYEMIEPLLRPEGLTTWVGGVIPASLQGQRAAERDLVRGELIALPLVALLLVVFFRGVVVASLPLLVGGFAVAAALACLRLLTHVGEVSIFAMNIVTFLGLGVAVDYSLFMTSRFRDELHAGQSVEAALERTMTTAGRTIAYSGVAVAASLLGLLVFRMNLLRSVAVAGTVVVLMALVATLLFLPAGLAALGHKIELLRVGRKWTAQRRGAWARIANTVMRAPVTVAVLTTAFLLLLGAPFLRLEGSVGGITVLPVEAEARKVADLLASDRFTAEEMPSIQVVLTTEAPVLTEAGLESVERYVDAVSGLGQVASVEAVVGGEGGRSPSEVLGMLAQPGAVGAQVRGRLERIVQGDRTVLQVATSVPAGSSAAESLVEEIRTVDVPGVDAVVGGTPAQQLDLRNALSSRLPWAITIICAFTFVVLFLAFGSLVMPLKAILMNILSLTASFGALVWIFQDGRFEWLLGYTSTGTIELTIPVVMFAVVFGLAMDYELFLLSRIREAYDAEKDSKTSVATGLEQTGRIITRAALLLIAVMLGFIMADMRLIKELGVGMAIAIAVDATIVRALLVPATMELLGRYNWWAPGWLARLWRKLGIGVEEGEAQPTAT